MKGNLTLSPMHHTYSRFDMTVRHRGFPRTQKKKTIYVLFVINTEGWTNYKLVILQIKVPAYIYTETDVRVVVATNKLHLLQP